ncbi:MAG: hypothetical protein AVDCRST_MAG93-2248, partial [uncultured Chloroflexia bacterium]
GDGGGHDSRGHEQDHGPSACSRGLL